MDHIQHYANLKYNLERLREFYDWLGRDFSYLEEDMRLFYRLGGDEDILRNYDLVRDFNSVVNTWYEQDKHWGENDNLVLGGFRAVRYSRGQRGISPDAYPAIQFHPMSAFKGWRTPKIKIIDQSIRTFFLDRLYNY